MDKRTAFYRTVNAHRDALSIREGGHRSAAIIASDQLLVALLRHGAKHGLPNISADQCRAKLATM